MGDDIVLEVPLDKQLSEIIKMVQDVLRQRFTPEGRGRAGLRRARQPHARHSFRYRAAGVPRER